ncbi:unnamed protein product [Dicrocoelium dendriticum]|nr:unnamed protein product [Dicrocoelium dendriticum]
MLNLQKAFRITVNLHPSIYSAFFATQALSLEPVGQLQRLSDTSYEPGQLFLHKHFGYRGIILQSWPAKLFDRNILSSKTVEVTTHEYKKEDGIGVTMYQVLTDQRDTDLCVPVLKPGVTFLPDDKRIFNTIYIVSGMDYVFHDDVIPYTSADPTPIKNEYLQEFMVSACDREPSLVPTDQLRRWIEARKQSLEVTCVHREETEGIRTTAVPFFMGRRLASSLRPIYSTHLLNINAEISRTIPDLPFLDTKFHVN